MENSRQGCKYSLPVAINNYNMKIQNSINKKII